MTNPWVLPDHLDLGFLRAFDEAPGAVVLLPEARARIRRSHAHLQALLDSGTPVYGVNTGFGPLSGRRIGPDAMADLQRRLVLSNAAGVGAPLPTRIVRRIMLLKVATLAAGASGTREALADALLGLIAADIVPLIPEKGSVGASGDLAPLAHLGAALIGEGLVMVRGERIPAAEALRMAGLAPFALGPKEGLALVNGTQVSTALAVEGLFALEDCTAAALACGAVSLEAGSGSAAAFDPRIHALRGQEGQAAAAAALIALLDSSPLQAAPPVQRIQDPYCLRCMPQVIGAVLDQLWHARRVLEREVAAVTDNPLFDPETGDVLYGGNFHAQPVGLAADQMALGFAELGSMAERRIAFLVDATQSGLPAFLAPNPGLDSGFMVAQVTAAALASENKALAHPASIDSIPTAANQEDYVSMATHAARRLLAMTENVRAILAIELLAAAQGLELRRPARSSDEIEAIVAALRTRVPPWQTDRFFAPDIAAATEIVSAAPWREALGARLALPITPPGHHLSR
jgi:histidine ammonia-lyase